MADQDATTPKQKVTALCPAGVGHDRLQYEHSYTERAFRAAWEKMHVGPAHSLSTSADLLANLLDTDKRGYADGAFNRPPRPAPACCRVTAASLIQWLGTNVGQSFLGEVEKAIREQAARG